MSKIRRLPAAGMVAGCAPTGKRLKFSGPEPALISSLHLSQRVVIPKAEQPDFRVPHPASCGNRALWRGLRNLGAGTAEASIP
jgi:hypothetical protein